MGRSLLAPLLVGVCACSSRGMAFGHSLGGASLSAVAKFRGFKALVVGRLIGRMGCCKSGSRCTAVFLSLVMSVVIFVYI